MNLDQQNRQKILQESSERGIEILRVLALSIRAKRDFGAIPSIRVTVGALVKTDEILQASQLTPSRLVKVERHFNVGK